MVARMIDLTSQMPREIRPLRSGAVESAITSALAHSGLDRVDSVRRDSRGRLPSTQGVIDRYRVDSEQRGWGAYQNMHGRNDSVGFTGVGAPGFPRDFEHIRAKVWEEKRQPLNALSLYPIDTGVPLGAKTHTARRHIGQGRAEIHRGGSDVPLAQGAYVEETFGTCFVVCAVNHNFFEGLATDYAGLRNHEMDLRLARRLVDEKVNEIAWFGDQPSNLYGLWNYPSQALEVLSTPFTDASTGVDVAKALLDLLATPVIVSGTRFSPNRLVVSPRIKHYLTTRQHDSGSGSDLTIEQWVLAGNQNISSIEVAQELQGIGPDGEDGIHAFRHDVETLSTVLIQAPTVLPVYQSGPFDQQTVVYAALGGAVGGDIGNNIAALVETITF